MVDGTAILMTMMWGLKQIGVWDEERGTNLLDTGAPFYDTYETDGRQVHLARLARAAVLRRADRAASASTSDGPARADGPRAAGPTLRDAVHRRCSRRRRATSGTRSCAAPTRASRRC